MKNISLLLILLITSFAGHATDKIVKEYLGTYKTAGESGCSMTMIVTAQGDTYHYKIKTSAKVREGRLEVTKMGDEIYFRFIGLLGVKPKTVIEGQYIDKQIVIQNDGNAMNKFLNFKECDEKYIEFSKTENK